MVLSGTCMLILVLGLIFAIVALCGVRGRKGILIPAIVGLVLNALLIAAMAMNRGYGRSSPMGGIYLAQEELAGVQARNPEADLNGSPDFITVHPDLLEIGCVGYARRVQLTFGTLLKRPV